MCFSFSWIGQLLIWAIAIGAAFLILGAIVRFVLPKIGIPIAAEIVALLTYVIKVAIMAAVCIFLVIICFDVIACLFSMGGPLPRLHG